MSVECHATILGILNYRSQFYFVLFSRVVEGIQTGLADQVKQLVDAQSETAKRVEAVEGNLAQSLQSMQEDLDAVRLWT